VRCLIVDDYRDFIDVARSLLESQGIAVVGDASTSTEALHLVEELQPDVTLVDINLGAESGFDLAERLHRNGRKAPVILISTHAEQDVAEMLEASPAVGFLSKSALSSSAIFELLGGGSDGRIGESEEN
jgi:CheY-like chemotaxis protein